ncbi:30S ribosomal protein S13 [Patescibacteria group bacterium]|nr:30S ribosomal protein S13 [Patescibacteria group bacterium]MBU1931303.1 30S ribosomal protein S13 [Patescibacteria group bacterium]
MARVSGVEIADKKKIGIALTAIYGLGRFKAIKVLKEANISRDKKTSDLSGEELTRLQKAVATLPVEGSLRKLVSENIKRLKQINSYRGLRHTAGLPSRGQRTRHNARTKRGKRRTVGAMKKAESTKLEQVKKAKETVKGK